MMPLRVCENKEQALKFRMLPKHKRDYLVDIVQIVAPSRTPIPLQISKFLLQKR